MIVAKENFKDIISILSKEPALACDTETTGFRAYKGDRLFSIQFSGENEDYYFNFQEYTGQEPKLEFCMIADLQPLFDDKLLFLQNAKFDMSFLYKEGVRFDKTDFHDTEVAGRIIRNNFLKYSLDEQTKRAFGSGKDESVMEWLKKEKCFTPVKIPGKDEVFKAYHFEKVPFELIVPYGLKDTRLTYNLGKLQISQLEKMRDETVAGGNPWAVYQMEKDLVKTCFNIERHGIQIDWKFCNEAIDFETQRNSEAEEAFVRETGAALVDSGKHLGPIFERFGCIPGKTETGEAEITDDFLAKVEHPAGKILQTYRDSRKRKNTYFLNYLHFADEKNQIHANMKQAGTNTGRFSYMDPNLQNIPNEDDSKYPVRRAFMPRPGFFFLSIDYDQMEFKMLLDQAEQLDLAAKVKAGHDCHTATAELTGLSRKQAKTLNFALLYGVGLEKLGVMLGCSKEEAAAFKRQYFAALPMVENFIVQCKGAVNQRLRINPQEGYIKTWFGRRGYFDESKWAYRAANMKIQGGCADVVKKAMNELDFFLRTFKSRMVLQVHDELLFEIAYGEEAVIDTIIEIMETAYPATHLPLTCSMAHSSISFFDLTDGDPRIVQKKGNSFQGEISTQA